MIFNKTTLGAISSSIQTGPFGSQLHQSDYSSEGVPVVMPKDLINGKISEESIARVSLEHVDRLGRHKIKNGDILYSRRGDVGKCAYATNKELGWLCGTGCLRVTIDPKKADSKFVFYSLQKSETIGWVINHAVGSTMLNLNTSILADVPLVLPSIQEQKYVVSILSAYDGLIENNQKQIKLLEEAAQRLYKEWFVDLRFPGHKNTKIVDGVPERWKWGYVDDVVVYHDNLRKPLSSKQREGQQKLYPYYGAATLMDYVETYIFDGVYLLFGEDGSVITSDGFPVLQYVWGKFWVNNHAHVFQGKEPFSTECAYVMFKEMSISDVVTGAAQPKISQGRLTQKVVLLPEKELIYKFNKIIEPTFKKIRCLSNQINNLKEARDRMLPKLMSGELEV